jgi:hypothetical protein
VWPDGSVSKQKVIIQKWNETVNDHGHEYSYEQERAVVGVMVNGLQKMIAVEGLECKRIPDGEKKEN